LSYREGWGEGFEPRFEPERVSEARERRRPRIPEGPQVNPSRSVSAEPSGQGDGRAVRSWVFTRETAELRAGETSLPVHMTREVFHLLDLPQETQERVGCGSVVPTVSQYASRGKPRRSRSSPNRGSVLNGRSSG